MADYVMVAGGGPPLDPVLEESHVVVAGSVVREGLRDERRVPGVEQGGQSAAQRRADVGRESVVVRARAPQLLECVPDAGGDAGARVGEVPSRSKRSVRSLMAPGLQRIPVEGSGLPQVIRDPGAASSSTRSSV